MEIAKHDDIHLREHISLLYETVDGKRIRHIVHQVQVVDVEMACIDFRGMPPDIVNWRNSGDSSIFQWRTLFSERARTKDEWILEMVGMTVESEDHPRTN